MFRPIFPCFRSSGVLPCPLCAQGVDAPLWNDPPVLNRIWMPIRKKISAVGKRLGYVPDLESTESQRRIKELKSLGITHPQAAAVVAAEHYYWMNYGPFSWSFYVPMSGYSILLVFPPVSRFLYDHPLASNIAAAAIGAVVAGLLVRQRRSRVNSFAVLLRTAGDVLTSLHRRYKPQLQESATNKRRARTLTRYVAINRTLAQDAWKIAEEMSFLQTGSRSASSEALQGNGYARAVFAASCTPQSAYVINEAAEACADLIKRMTSGHPADFIDANFVTRAPKLSSRPGWANIKVRIAIFLSLPVVVAALAALLQAVLRLMVK